MRQSDFQFHLSEVLLVLRGILRLKISPVLGNAWSPVIYQNASNTCVLRFCKVAILTFLMLLLLTYFRAVSTILLFVKIQFYK